MATLHGNEIGIYIDTTTGANGADFGPTTYELVACATNASINLSNATIETACKSSSAGDLNDASVRHTIPGQQTWNMQVDGLADITAATDGEKNFVDLMDLAIGRTSIYVAFSTGVDADIEYFGAGFISSIDANASVDDFVSYSCTIEGNGNLTKRTVDYTA